MSKKEEKTRKMSKTSEKDNEILAYISDCFEKNGYAPSVRDIQSAFDIKSTSTVHASLARLEKRGLLHKEHGKSRALRVGQNEGAHQGFGENRSIPIVGRVAAGYPIFADENTEGFIDFPIPENEFRYNKYFALRVKGESMINAGILDGDILIVKKTDYAENGAIVVAGIGDEATVKRFYKENGHYRLQPENDRFEPIITDEVFILGTVRASIRYYE